MAKEIKQENNQAAVAEAVSKTDLFFKENGKALAIVAAAAVIIAAAVFCYVKFAYQPKVAEAQEQTYPAEAAFRAGSFETALNGDGNALGFADIIDQYGTKAGKAVYLYAGICALQMQNYEEAVDYLKKYNGKDKILAARAQGCIGDAYVGLEQYEKALEAFKAAAAKGDNMFAATYLLKAGVVAEELGKTEQALSLYKEIKEKYPQSIEGYDIDKYITRIEANK